MPGAGEYNPLQPNSITKLREAIRYARLRQVPMRENRMAMLRQYVGKYYSDDGSKEKVPINLLELFCTIYRRILCANRPRGLVTTSRRQYRGYAQDLEVALNHRIEKINLATTLDIAIFDSLFGPGIVKVGLCSSGIVDVGDSRYEHGEPFADAISIDDWVNDVVARRREQWHFCGHRYRVPREMAMENKDYDKDVREKLTATYGRPVDEFGIEKDEALSRGNTTYPQQDIYEMVDLWDIYLPLEGLVVTLPDDSFGAGGGTSDPLEIKEWEGPEHGPYHILAHNEVPGNTMPLSPVSLLYDMHDLVNRLFIKVGRQGERQKTVVGYQGTAEEDAKRVQNAADGEMILMNNPQLTREFRFGGVDGPTLAATLQFRDIFSWLGGNLDSLGGLSPQAGTLGQDELLSRAASKRVEAMQDRAIDFVRKICKDLAWYDWHDPLYDQQLVRKIPGSDIQIPFRMTAEGRRGEFYDYNFDIEPYSLQDSPPAKKLSTIMQIYQGVIAPNMQAMMQQGINFNFEAFLREIGKLGNCPELEDFVIYSTNQPSPSSPEEPGGGKPANTTRTYERVNRPGATRQQKDQMMSHLMMGGNAQPAEMATIARPTG